MMDSKTLKTAGSSPSLLATSSGAHNSAGNIHSDEAESNRIHNTNQQSGSGATAVTPTSLGESIKSQKEWVKVVAFEHDGRIVAATVKPHEGEVE